MIDIEKHKNNGHGVGVRGSSRGSEDEKLSHIRAIVIDVMRRRRQGADVDDEAVIREHPRLMPELGERLDTLKAITAARRASRDDQSDAAHGIVADTVTDDLQFLNSTLKRYAFIERAHVGGQGVVFKAVQRANRRIVAVKVLLDGPLASSRQRLRFDREIELVSRLRHPNIVSLYEAGTIRGRHYFAMEFVDGLPIDEHVLLNDMNTRQVVGLFVKVCRALSYAHQNRIIHRDVKPANILVDLEGEPHVLDFGLAKDTAAAPADHAASSFSQDRLIGTLPYSSPEQVGGLDGVVDTRCDIYSLGVVLYRLLTERFPYAVNGDEQTVRSNILSADPVPLRLALTETEIKAYPPAGGIDRDLEAIVAKALAKEKERRYQSVAEFADDLERYLAGDAIVARAEKSLYGYVLKKVLRKHRLRISLAAAVILVFSVGMTAMWVHAEGMRKQAESLARDFDRGLHVVSLVEEATTLRDRGFPERSIRLFEQAAEIGDAIATRSSTVQRFTFHAHHRVANMYLNIADERQVAKQRGESPGRMARQMFQAARRHSDSLSHLTSQMLEQDSQNADLQQCRALANVVEARAYDPEKRSKGGRALLERAARICATLLREDPNNSLLNSRLAWIYGFLGEWCVNLKDWDASGESLMRARDIRVLQYRDQPDDSKRTVGLAEALTNVGAWYMSPENPRFSRAKALEHFEQAKSLVDSENPDHLASQRGDVQQILARIALNKRNLAE